jgi:hypothetical protein
MGGKDEGLRIKDEARKQKRRPDDWKSETCLG